MIEYDSAPAGELFEALEQLETIRDLILSDSPIKARMALILLDALADAVIFRRLESIYEATGDPLLGRSLPRYTSEDRALATRRFSRRVAIARAAPELDRYRNAGHEFISAADAEILNACHRLRNDAYHEDLHNARVIGQILR